MTSPRTLAATLHDEIAALLMPLVAAAQHPGGVTLLLRSLGHTDEFAERPELRAELERLATLAQQITDLPTDTLESPDGIVQVLRLGSDLFGAVRGIEQLVQDPSLVEQAQGLGLDLVEQLTALHLRTRHPTLLRIANLLTLVTPAETGEPRLMSMQGTKLVRLGWRGDRFHFDRIGALLDRPLPTLAEYYFPKGLAAAADAHESARRLFPLLHLASQALSLSNFQDVVPADPNAVAPVAPAEVNVSDHFGEHDDDEPPLPDIPVPEAIDLTPYFEAHLPRFVTVLPGLVVDGVVAPARLALVTKVSSARHPGAARGLVVHPLGQLKLEESRAGWRLSIESDGQVPGWLFGPDGVGLAPTEATPVAASVRLRVEREAAPGTPAFVFGAASGTRLEIGALQITIEARVVKSRADLSASIDAKSAAIVLASDDGFLSSLVPEGGLRTGFDLGLGWSSERGLTLRGSAGLDAVLPIDRSLGGLTLRSLRLRLQARNAEIAAEITANLVASMGPVSALVDGLGLEALTSFPREGGNLGIVDLDVRFKPPTGMGLVIDAPAVTGGGFLQFDPARAEYSGILQLEIAETIAVKAIGLLTTRLPDGSKGFSLVIIIAAEGFPPIQLGFGFTLTGIGGLLGVNRTVMADVLRSGLKNGTLGSILFPADPIRNAPHIVSDLRAVFPPVRDRYVFGPMAKIAWGTPTILTLEIGLLLELPEPVRLIILGRLQTVLPDPDLALIRVRMDAIGVIDFNKEEVSLDATLYESRILQFVLTGDMALRANWGRQATFVLAVGGFNPRFRAPSGFPLLARLALSLGDSDNPRLRFESYLALTSNTVQFGARFEFAYSAAGFTLAGLLAFDALFQFSPFQFIVDVGAMVALKRGSSVLMGVFLDMTVAGPTPWHIRGTATFKVLFFKVSIRFDHRFGDDPPPALPPAIDLLALVAEALGDRRNWTSALPRGEHSIVSLRETQTTTPVTLRVHPMAELTVRQRVVPLNVTVTRFGNVPLAAPTVFAVAVSAGGAASMPSTPVRDSFALAQFQEMSDDEKLARPAFELQDAGLHFAAEAAAYQYDALPDTSIAYETLIIDPTRPAETATTSQPYVMPPAVLDAVVSLGAAGQSAIRRRGSSRYRTPEPLA